MGTKQVFFYGLFMDPDLLASRGLSPENPRIAFLDDFALWIGERAALVPEPGARTYGIVTEISANGLDTLYSDKTVSDYLPGPVTLTLPDGSVTEAACYNLPREKIAPARNQEYARKLAELAGRLGLPDEYVAAIRSATC